MSRLDRLMRLAQKTGDTLIIHDAEGRDLVLLDVGKYEDLLEETHFDVFDDRDLYDMSEGQMLDKINRDIAIWRSHQEDGERMGRANHIEHHLSENPLPDPFEEDYSHASDWHKAGSILEKRHPKFGDDDMWDMGDSKKASLHGVNVMPDFEPAWNLSPDMYDEDEDVDDELDVFGFEDIDASQKKGEEKKDTNLVYDSLGEESLYDTSSRKDVPYIEHGSVETHKTDDESDDEPVFFEEPV